MLYVSIFLFKNNLFIRVSINYIKTIYRFYYRFYKYPNMSTRGKQKALLILELRKSLYFMFESIKQWFSFTKLRN